MFFWLELELKYREAELERKLMKRWSTDYRHQPSLFR